MEINKWGFTFMSSVHKATIDLLVPLSFSRSLSLSLSKTLIIFVRDGTSVVSRRQY